MVLLSGGMDSTTCLAMAAAGGTTCWTLAFDYGQRHRVELQMAARQARAFGAQEHRVVRVDLAAFGGSVLTGDGEVPKGDDGDRVPPTYVPARNAVFLSLGLCWAEVLGVPNLVVGANQVDFSGYPDCRGAFLEAFETMANLGTRMGQQGGHVRVAAPLLDLRKAEIIRKGIELGVDYGMTHTCYDPVPDGRPCGRCPSCRLRLKGFSEAGIEDPLEYPPAS